MEKSAQRSSSLASTKSAANKSQEAVADLNSKIPEIDRIFNVHCRIGNGTFSTVLLATLKKDQHLQQKHRKKYAIKHHVPTSHPDRIIKELKCMTEIGGKDNVVGIFCTLRHNESVAFVMPYLAHDRFHDFYDKMPLEEIQCFIKNLLIALRRVHKYNVIHRDVKPSNFLYNRNTRQFLLVDFGLAQEIAPKTTAKLNAQPVKAKRRECDDSEGVPTSGNEESTAKRLRCSQSTETPPATPFKMPLRQLNINTTPTKGTAVQLQSPLSRQIKSAVLGVSLTDRLQQRNKNTAAALQKAENPVPPATPINPSRPLQYSTSKKPNAKCYCYGKPQICNICLIKKEVHASRAGTPGYRSPEVLLKYPDQTTAVDIWAVGVIFMSILSSVYPFFKAPDDYVALAEMVTIFGDKAIRKTAFVLGRIVTISHWTKPLDLRKLCVRLRNHRRTGFAAELEAKYTTIMQGSNMEVCKNCEQLFYDCLCKESSFNGEEILETDIFPASAYDLLYKLLELNPHKRISAQEALEHPFFEEAICETAVTTNLAV